MWLSLAWTSALSAQVFELPLTTWGPIEARRGSIGPGLIEVIAALLVLEALALVLLCGLLGRRIRRLRSLHRGAVAAGSRPGQPGRRLEEKVLRRIAFFLAPTSGLLGALLGRGFTLWGLDLSLLLAAGAVGILVLAGLSFVAESRELLLVGHRNPGPLEAG